MSEEGDVILVEVSRHQTARVEVRVPSGASLPLDWNDALRETLDSENFWDGLYDKAAWSPQWRQKVYPLQVLGRLNAGATEPQWRWISGMRWPTNAVQLDARPYLSGGKEGEE